MKIIFYKVNMVPGLAPCSPRLQRVTVDGGSHSVPPMKLNAKVSMSKTLDTHKRSQEVNTTDYPNTQIISSPSPLPTPEEVMHSPYAHWCGDQLQLGNKMTQCGLTWS